MPDGHFLDGRLLSAAAYSLLRPYRSAVHRIDRDVRVFQRESMRLATLHRRVLPGPGRHVPRSMTVILVGVVVVVAGRVPVRIGLSAPVTKGGSSNSSSVGLVLQVVLEPSVE